MKIFLALAFSLISAALGVTASDRLVLSQGPPVEGTFKGITGTRVAFERQITQGAMLVSFDLGQIQRLEVSLPAKLRAALPAPGPDDLDRLRTAWKPYVGVSQIPPGTLAELAAALAVTLSDSPEAAQRAEGKELIGKLEATAGRDPALRPQILRAQALQVFHQGDAQATEAFFQNIPPADQSVVAELRTRLRLAAARRAVAELDALETEWPKWHLMSEMIARRRELIDEALFGFLDAPVRNPSDSEAAAEGLLEAARLLARINDADGAQKRLDFLKTAYPGTAAASRATKISIHPPDKKPTE